jgi:hypothetical protein
MKEIGERPAVKRGRMVDRASGPPEQQLRERHDAKLCITGPPPRVPRAKLVRVFSVEVRGGPFGTPYMPHSKPFALKTALAADEVRNVTSAPAAPA